jgi:alkanesulfonate monooxygenase SsuD/methylene tetrahydromethanopterin reductase-like flavin-dependent oxidoreductase (luciferase family)
VTSSPLATGGVSMRLYPHDLPADQQIAEMRLQARLAVEAGFDGVMVSEHHADYPGYVPNPIQMAGLLLPAMPHGWAAASPMLLPMQPYALVAEQIAWLAACYPGRVGAGFGAGAVPGDFELAEVPFEEITERFKAALPKVVAALRGQDPTPLGNDRALRRCEANPIPIVVAAQSKAAVQRAARLGIGILYDSLQTPEATARMSGIYDEAGGVGPKILIRRVWMGDTPEAALEAQMARFHVHAPERAVKNWGTGTGLVQGANGVEAAERLVAAARESGCDTLNVRIYLAGLTQAQVRDQIERHATELLPHLRKIWSAS